MSVVQIRPPKRLENGLHQVSNSCSEVSMEIWVLDQLIMAQAHTKCAKDHLVITLKENPSKMYKKPQKQREKVPIETKLVQDQSTHTICGLKKTLDCCFFYIFFPPFFHFWLRFDPLNLHRNSPNRVYFWSRPEVSGQTRFPFNIKSFFWKHSWGLGMQNLLKLWVIMSHAILESFINIKGVWTRQQEDLVLVFLKIHLRILSSDKRNINIYFFLNSVC